MRTLLRVPLVSVLAKLYCSRLLKENENVAWFTRYNKAAVARFHSYLMKNSIGYRGAVL